MKISVPVAFSLVAVEVPLNFAEFQQARADSPEGQGEWVASPGLGPCQFALDTLFFASLLKPDESFGAGGVFPGRCRGAIELRRVPAGSRGFADQVGWGGGPLRPSLDHPCGQKPPETV